MGSNEPLDFLLEALEQELSDSDNEDPNDVVRPVHVSSADLSSTPETSRLDPRHSKFLSSSSLRKKRFKPSHCKYCPRFRNNRQQLEEHLIQSDICLSLYLRDASTKSHILCSILLYKLNPFFFGINVQHRTT